MSVLEFKRRCAHLTKKVYRDSECRGSRDRDSRSPSRCDSPDSMGMSSLRSHRSQKEEDDVEGEEDPAACRKVFNDMEATMEDLEEKYPGTRNAVRMGLSPGPKGPTSSSSSSSESESSARPARTGAAPPVETAETAPAETAAAQTAPAETAPAGTAGGEDSNASMAGEDNRKVKSEPSRSPPRMAEDAGLERPPPPNPSTATTESAASSTATAELAGPSTAPTEPAGPSTPAVSTGNPPPTEPAVSEDAYMGGGEDMSGSWVEVRQEDLPQYIPRRE